MAPTPIDRDVQAIEDWYLRLVRPFLERIGKIDVKPDRLGDFDAELDRLRRARSAYDDELVVCFLGLAGVGKSTYPCEHAEAVNRAKSCKFFV